MSQEAAAPLFPALDQESRVEPDFSTGILPAQALREAIARGEIEAEEPVAEEQIQPASLDLRLGHYAYRVRASFLPGPRTSVAQVLDRLSMHRIDLTDGAVLEKDCVYIVPLLESLALKRRLTAVANPKSSTGRLDIFARLITDYGSEFDRVPEGYRGPLWVELSPRSFSVLVRSGSRLLQMRLKRGSPPPSETALRRLHDEVGLVDVEGGAADIKQGRLAVSVDTQGTGEGALVGYRAKKSTGLIDVEKIDHYDPLDFWEPLHARGEDGIVLNPNDFYILASKEAVTVPADHAAEMIAYDTLVGEFRVHYAGFFDPGFGYAEAGGEGARAVLEIRSHDVPFILQDGQTVGRLFYERLTARPERLYGQGIGSSYQRQGLALAKQFKRQR